MVLPNTPGIGFKPQHFEAIRQNVGPVGFLEIHAENYMGAGGLPHAQLSALRPDFALSLHGVGLSIGGPGRLDTDHLARLKTLCDRYEPESFSEHRYTSRATTDAFPHSWKLYEMSRETLCSAFNANLCCYRKK